jgi:hypothetical protein
VEEAAAAATTVAAADSTALTVAAAATDGAVRAYKHDVQPPSWLTLVYLYGYRSLLQCWRSVSVLQVELFMFILAGCVLGMAFVTSNWFLLPLPAEYERYCPDPMARSCRDDALKDTLGLQTTYTVMALGLVCAIIANRTFGQERDNIARESAAGMSLSAYFAGKALAELPLIVAYSFAFSVAFWLVCSPAAQFGAYYAVILLFCLTLYGIGEVSSLLFIGAPENALLCSAISALLGGLATDADSPVKNACWSRWAAEAIFLSNVRSERMPQRLQGMLQQYMDSSSKFVIGAYAKDLGVLALMAVVLRLLTLAIMWRKFRK